MTSIQHIIGPHVRDLGGFSVKRVLPAAARQTVGPFIFFDHMGPVDFAPARASTCVRIRISAWPP